MITHFDNNPRQIIPMGRIIKFAVATAMRQEEICRATWSDLNTRTKMLTIRDREDPRQKKGNDQRIPLFAVSGYDAAALIEEQRAIRGDRIAMTAVCRPCPARQGRQAPQAGAAHQPLDPAAPDAASMIKGPPCPECRVQTFQGRETSYFGLPACSAPDTLPRAQELRSDSRFRRHRFEAARSFLKWGSRRDPTRRRPMPA